MQHEKAEYIEITSRELDILKFINLEQFDLKKCSKQFNLSLNEISQLILDIRKKVTIAIIEDIPIKITQCETKEKVNTICKFRCAICGSIYTIDYTNEEITCPLCFSKEIMTNQDAGFLK
ncbi:MULTISPECIES: hypothetical protein [Romboutsia]|uniref:Uncharacterized protein n=1 Tax=Romboutsia hominis TaxID=1507512 RepID=A0A2P2BR56_9FIRM|nr:MULTISPECIES: hypothetical protein [Romboutsia]MCH1960192.1 hypothetical protein [Romboutsia hominis]MCH1969373.1 hypothetical protein [Romboutsia hominis]CEI72850.1 Hypothetical protein FRIFI_1315 [Romboutsia hominis]